MLYFIYIRNIICCTVSLCDVQSEKFSLERQYSIYGPKEKWKISFPFGHNPQKGNDINQKKHSENIKSHDCTLFLDKRYRHKDKIR